MIRVCICVLQDGELDPSVYSTEVKCNVSSFGHGRHACPGQRFAMSVLKTVLVQYVTNLSIVPTFSNVAIPETSVGAIARASHPCIVTYMKRF